jgi:hypothetical protein
MNNFIFTAEAIINQIVLGQTRVVYSEKYRYQSKEKQSGMGRDSHITNMEI